VIGRETDRQEEVEYLDVHPDNRETSVENNEVEMRGINLG
jgi:hypothetical protein